MLPHERQMRRICDRIEERKRRETRLRVLKPLSACVDSRERVGADDRALKHVRDVKTTLEFFCKECNIRLEPFQREMCNAVMAGRFNKVFGDRASELRVPALRILGVLSDEEAESLTEPARWHPAVRQAAVRKLEEYDRKFTVVRVPRRSGKNRAGQLVVAALLVHESGISVVNWAQDLNCARTNREDVIKLLEMARPRYGISFQGVPDGVKVTQRSGATANFRSKPNTANTMSRETAFPTFVAGLAYLFKAQCEGEERSRLVELVSSCLGTTSKNAFRIKWARCNDEEKRQFEAAVALGGYPAGRDDDHPERERDADEARKNAFVRYFYDTLVRPHHSKIAAAVCNLDEIRRWLECDPDQRKTSAHVVPKTDRVHESAIVRVVLAHLNNVKTKPLHPMLKRVLEFTRSNWPFNLLFVVPDRSVGLVACVVILNDVRERKFTPSRVTKALSLLNEEEASEMKSVLFVQRRCAQVQYAYDMTREPGPGSESIVICRYCYIVLTYVDLKNRPPTKGVYIDENTLEPVCYSCHSRRLATLALDGAGVRLTVKQPDLARMRACRCGAITSRDACASCELSDK